MGFPSIKTLMSSFPKLTRGEASDIRWHMENRNIRQAMNKADQYLETHGIEYIPPGHNAKSPAIYYCNMGDSYSTTILYVNGRYRIGSWGDIVERGNYD